MVTKRCEICRKVKQIDEMDLSCRQCEERELDMLMQVYAYIHIYDSDYCPPQEIMQGVPSVNGVKVTLPFLKSWANKNWLEKNYFEALGVPETISEELQESGFQASSGLRNVLVERREEGIRHSVDSLREFREIVEMDDEKKKTGMVFMQKKRNV